LGRPSGGLSRPCRMSLALKLALSPLLVAQALATKRRAPTLPEAAGPREGRLGRGGDAIRVLIAGDSAAAGVGVASQHHALAGHLTRTLHRCAARPVAWSLHARSGLTTQQVHALLRSTALQRADVAVVVTGVNDVIDQIPSQRAVQYRAALADWLLAEGIVAHVLFAPLPPVHHFPLLPQPLRRVMGDDARRHDDAMARWAATRSDVSHLVIALDLTPEVMASDGFHPGEPVYRTCGEALAAHIATMKFKETAT
jgi:lysophospholipase L1-like esterase